MKDLTPIERAVIKEALTELWHNRMKNLSPRSPYFIEFKKTLKRLKDTIPRSETL